MTRRGTPEADVQRSIVTLLRAVIPAPGMIHASGHEQPGRSREWARRQAILKGMGALAGFPDLIVLADGVTLFLEVKAPGGSLSPAQREFRDHAQAQGFPWALVRSADDALAAVHAAGIKTRAADHRITPNWQPIGVVAQTLVSRARMCHKNEAGPKALPTPTTPDHNADERSINDGC